MTEQTESYLRDQMAYLIRVIDGKDGDSGLKAQVDRNARAIARHIEYCESRTNKYWSRVGAIIMVVFRAFVTLALVFIAYKMGWK